MRILMSLFTRRFEGTYYRAYPWARGLVANGHEVTVMCVSPTSRFSSPGFDFTSQMRTLCNDLVARVPDLRHIDMGRVALAFCQTRKRVQHGLHASLTPMRFEGGRITTTRRGRDYTLQRLYDPDGCEMLYILRFYMPRFQNLAFEEKLTTVLHECAMVGMLPHGSFPLFAGVVFLGR